MKIVFLKLNIFFSVFVILFAFSKGALISIEPVVGDFIASNALQSYLNPKILKKNGGILQIQVLDQRKTRFGEEACGYHSWKNALIALAITGADNKSDVESLQNLFNDKDFYHKEVVEFFYPNHSIPQGAKDLSIVEAHRAYTRLITENIKTKNLKKIASIVKKNPSSISFLNPTNEILFGGLDESSLSNIENFYKVVMQSGFAVHAIVVGKFPHWTTLIMERDDRQIITWYGCDSYGNQTGELLKNKELLESFIKNLKGLDKQVLIGYVDAVGFDLQNKANWLKKGVIELLLQSKKPINVRRNFDSESLNIHAIPRKIGLAFDFLNNMNLIKNPEFKEYLLNIKELADFYTKNLESDHPSAQKMREISAVFMNASSH